MLLQKLVVSLVEKYIARQLPSWNLHCVERLVGMDKKTAVMINHILNTHSDFLKILRQEEWNTPRPYLSSSLLTHLCADVSGVTGSECSCKCPCIVLEVVTMDRFYML